jgi:hypothetical protein
MLPRQRLFLAVARRPPTAYDFVSVIYTDLSMTRRYHDDCRILDAASLYRCGCLKPGKYAWEWCQIGSQPRSTAEIVTEADIVRIEDQCLQFEWKPCKPTSGAEPAWRCPTCSRRCRKLYSPPGGLWRCRGCWELEYRIWHEGWMARTLRTVAQVGVPLAGDPVDGKVPVSYRERQRSSKRRVHRARMRELLAVAALEVLRKD